MTNDARFSMRLPQATLDFGHAYAAQSGTSLSELILGYLNRLQEAVAAKSPNSRSIRNIHKYRGILKADKPLTDKEREVLRFKYLSDKYA